MGKELGESRMCCIVREWFWDYAFQFLNSVGPSERVSDAHVEPLRQDASPMAFVHCLLAEHLFVFRNQQQTLLELIIFYYFFY